MGIVRTPGVEEFAPVDIGPIVAEFCNDSRHLAKLLEFLLKVGPAWIRKTLMPKHQKKTTDSLKRPWLLLHVPIMTLKII